MVKSKQERARRKCLEALLPNLEARGVTRVVMEERTPSLVESDRRMLTAVRGKRLITTALRVGTARPKEEPMLWLPDSVAGAFGAARDRGKPEWLELMAPIDRIDVSTL